MVFPSFFSCFCVFLDIFITSVFSFFRATYDAVRLPERAPRAPAALPIRVSAARAHVRVWGRSQHRRTPFVRSLPLSLQAVFPALRSAVRHAARDMQRTPFLMQAHRPHKEDCMSAGTILPPLSCFSLYAQYRRTRQERPKRKQKQFLQAKILFVFCFYFHANS